MFDSHAHYFDAKFDTLPGGAEALLCDPAFAKQIDGVLCLGTNLTNSRQCIEQAANHPFMYAAIGVHPEDCMTQEMTADATVSEMASLLRDSESRKQQKIVAIGEIGLDYHWGTEETARKRQRDFFEAQLALAEEMDLPVSVHDRDAHGDTFEIICRHPHVRGVLHAFSGSEELAREYQKRGWYFGFGGVLTYKNAERVRRVAASVSLSHILTETDCPYLTPEPHRGKINHSLYMKYVVDSLASLHNLSFAQTEALTVQNARTLFGI